MEQKDDPRTTRLCALERVIGSPTFARSERHRALLRHLVGKLVEGRSYEIKELTIALEVFGRDSYDPQLDAQVRVEVGKLRERLARYYAGEGSGDAVRIEIPRGSYVPVFSMPPSMTQTGPQGGAARRGRFDMPKRRVLFLGATVVAILIALIAIGIVGIRSGSLPGSSGTRARTSIAILPFEDLSPAKDLEYFCNGLTDELIGDLAGLQVFRVLPRSSVAQYKQRSTDAQKIAEQLNAHAVVEGTVRRERQRVRIDVRLIDARQRLLLWTGRYDGSLDEILDTQRKIAESIAQVFNRTLFDTARALLRQRTRNNVAYHHYLRAAYLYSNNTAQSIEHYRAAISADPAYALAWAGLAAAWIRLGEFEIAAPETARREGMAAAAKAISLDPELAESQWVWGVSKLYYERDWRAAERALLKAIELDRAFGRFRWEYARLILVPTQRLPECVDQLQAAIALEPANPILYNALANCYIKGRRYGEAIPHLEMSRKISPTSVSAVVLQGMTAAGRGDYEQALRRFEEAAKMRRSTWVLGHLGYTLARMGRLAEAWTIVAEMEKGRDREFRPNFDLAVVYAALGDTKRAMEGLEATLAEYSPPILWINVDYRLDDLRDHPRFARLVKAVGFD